MSADRATSGDVGSSVSAAAYSSLTIGQGRIARWAIDRPVQQTATPPWPPDGSASLHLRPTMAPEATMH